MVDSTNAQVQKGDAVLRLSSRFVKIVGTLVLSILVVTGLPGAAYGLEPAGQLSGTVYLGTSATTAGAGDVVVTLRQYVGGTTAPYPGASATTNASGQYIFTGLPGGTRFDLLFDYVGTGDFIAHSEPYSSLFPGTIYNTTIAVGYLIEGHVDLDTLGSPAGSGQVQVYLTGNPSFYGKTTLTDSAGNYSFGRIAIPTLQYYLSFRYAGTEGYPDWYYSSDGVGSRDYQKASPINPTGNRSDYNAIVGFGTSIEGYVFDSSGIPVVGLAGVADAYDPSVVGGDPFRGHYATVTDAQGHYRVRALPSQYHYVVSFGTGTDSWAFATAGGGDIFHWAGYVDGAGGTLHQGVNIVLYRASAISGLVQGSGLPDPAGGPDQVQAWLYHLNPATNSWNQVDLKSVALSHSFSFTNLPPGQFKVAIVYNGPNSAPFITSNPQTVGDGVNGHANFWLAGSSSHARTFQDIQDTSSFGAEIEWMFNSGITSGYTTPGGPRTYNPLVAVSRQAMAAFLYRAAGSPAFAAPLTSSFSDVPTSSTYFAEIEWMKAQGITTGQPDGSGGYQFGPTLPVTRQAMSAFLYRAAGSPAFVAPSTPTFSDVGISNPFYREIEWMNAKGITTGYSGGIFKPNANVSRQAMAAFLYRAFA